MFKLKKKEFHQKKIQHLLSVMWLRSHTMPFRATTLKPEGRTYPSVTLRIAGNRKLGGTEPLSSHHGWRAATT